MKREEEMRKREEEIQDNMEFIQTEVGLVGTSFEAHAFGAGLDQEVAHQLIGQIHPNCKQEAKYTSQNHREVIPGSSTGLPYMLNTQLRRGPQILFVIKKVAPFIDCRNVVATLVWLYNIKGLSCCPKINNSCI